MVRRMKVERNTAVRSTATARRSGTVGVAASSTAQVVSGQVTNQGSLIVSDLPSLNPTPPQFLLSPGQQSYLSTSGNNMAQLAPMQQQLQPQQQQQISLSTMNEMPAQKLIRHGHQLELLTEAKILCDRQDFVDLTIYCEDGVVRAHQMLLAVASPFLMLLFQSNPSYENEDITLILPEVKACLVQALIHFVYTGVVVSNENHFYSLMKLVYALNINASIEAESTNDRATTFTAPLVAPSSLSQVLRLPQQQINPLLQQQNLAAALPQQLLPQQPVPLHHQSINGSASTANSSNVNAVAAAAVAAITQPAIAPPHLVPSTSKAARLSGPPSNAIPLPLQNLGQTTPSKLPIQLPTQPVPLVNGVVRGTEQQHLVNNASASAPTQQYIAIDPITGINYKVDMSLSSEVGSGPLAAIMNETIFQDTSGAIVPAPNAQIYQTDNGQVIYTTQPPPNATATIPTSMQIQQPQPLTSSPGQSGKRGKKRGASIKQEGGSPLNNNSPVISNTVPASILSSVQIVGDQSVDDLPCTPDDEDINTPYPCPSCNKTIKGKVMLQAHHFQEHYENPELNQVDIGDKHACRVCLKLFTRNSDVKAHILRVHCGDRRYPCTMCGKRFKESTHLRKHLYTHTGERPHFCSLCSKGFQTSSDLKRHKRTRVHQERVEQGGGIEPPESVESPPSTPVVVAAATASVARKSAPVAITTASCDIAATSSITNTSITSADGSLSATTTRWSDDEEMNEPGNTSSENASHVILNSITEPVAIIGSADDASASGQLIVPTTTSAAGGTITDAAESIVHVGDMVSVASTSSTATSVNWSGSGGGIVMTNASSPSASTPLDLKELTSASDMSAFIESATENIASAAPSASTSDPGSVVSLTAAHAPLLASLDNASTPDNVDGAMHVKMEVQSMDEHNNGMQVQGIDDVLMASDPGSNEESKIG